MTYIPRTGSMTPNNYLKGEIWSTLLQKKWYADSLISRITNNDWENEIKKFGQIVHIRKRPDAMVNPYVINQQVDWQTVNDEKITLTIDYAYYAAMKIDTVDIAQMDINLMNEMVDEIAKRQMNKEDEVFFSIVPGLAPVSVSSSGALTTTASSNTTYCLYDVAQIRVQMNRRFVPQEGRFIVVPPEVEDLLIRSDAARWDVSGEKNTQQTTGKYSFKIYGFEVYVSPFITGAGSAGSPYKCLAGTKDGVCFARQVTETEVGIQLQDYFGKGVKSLNVFGLQATGPAGSLIAWNARTS
jgi:hypothetical protein